MVSEHLLLLSREDTFIAVGKNAHKSTLGWEGSLEEGKATKDLHQLCGDIFYLISLLHPTCCLRPDERKACEGPYGAITGAGPSCALSRGLSLHDHAVQVGAHAPCPGGPHAEVGPTPPSSSLSLAGRKHT